MHANNAKLHTGSSLIGWAALTCVEDWHSRRGGHSEGGGGPAREQMFVITPRAGGKKGCK